MTLTAPTAVEIEARARRIAEDVARPAAADVDRRARFPKESLDALRDARLLSILVPRELGGEGASILETSHAVTALSRACGSTGMVFAMHQIQVACLVRHGLSSPYLRDYLADSIVDRQHLLASATTEVNIGGDVRRSQCAVEADDAEFRLKKTAPVISYGHYADAVLATARRTSTSPESDQVLALCRRPGLCLTSFGEWDTMGFRGTCSLGFELSATGPLAAVLPESYADISAQTMLPVSHVLWSAVWFGLADAAVRHVWAKVRDEARVKPGVMPPAAPRLAELVALHVQFKSLVEQMAVRIDQTQDPEALSEMEFVLQLNALKTASSALVLEIATKALSICGLSGYREDSATGMARIVRDADGAELMISNDRIIGHSAQMLLVSKEA